MCNYFGRRDFVFNKKNLTSTITTVDVTMKLGDLCSYSIKLPDDAIVGDRVDLVIRKLKNVKMSMHQYRDFGVNQFVNPSAVTIKDIWSKSVKYSDY